MSSDNYSPLLIKYSHNWRFPVAFGNQKKAHPIVKICYVIRSNVPQICVRLGYEGIWYLKIRSNRGLVLKVYTVNGPVFLK